MNNDHVVQAVSEAVGTEDRFALRQVLTQRPDAWAFIRAADNYLVAHLNRASESTIADFAETLLREKENLECQS
jgi:hypothetical protein